MLRVAMVIILIIFTTGCAAIYYDETWLHGPATPWPIPSQLRVVVADPGTIARICREKGAPIPDARGCYVARDATLYAVPGLELHEFKHIWEGYYHK